MEKDVNSLEKVCIYSRNPYLCIVKLNINDENCKREIRETAKSG